MMTIDEQQKSKLHEQQMNLTNKQEIVTHKRLLLSVFGYNNVFFGGKWEEGVNGDVYTDVGVGLII